MTHLTFKKTILILLHAFVVWALCGATMGIGLAVLGEQKALIVHAVGAPVFAALVSLFYYRKLNYTSPMQTALIFLLFVVVMDAGLVAPVFVKSYDMFLSALGTWIPFVLIFSSTYLTGIFVKRNKTLPDE